MTSLFKKATIVLKTRGALSLFQLAIVFILLHLCRYRFLSKRMLPEPLKTKLTARETFHDKSLIENARGYWHLHPMPTVDQLETYYRQTYWQDRGKQEGVNQRDLDHFLLLQELIPEFFQSPKTFLNFGAGHGGISHLFHLYGHKVLNIEPSGLSLAYNDRWTMYKNISEVIEGVDFIYGSHSLEHVQDIDTFEGIVWKSLKDKGYVFWEVPNARLPSNGGCNGVVHAPHTYYFTTSYFRTLNYTPLLNTTFKEGTFPNLKLNDDSGEVIRYLGQKLVA